MKIKIIAFLFLIFSGSVFAQNAASEEVTVPLTKPGETGRLEVELVFGSVTVTGTKGKEVKIIASSVDPRRAYRENENIKEKIKEKEERKAERYKSNEDVTGLRRIPNTGMSLTITEQNNRVKVSNESVNRPVHLEIQIPQNFDLKLTTVNNGDIIVKDVNGNFELENVNGSIVLENITGSAMASTVNGKIKANFLDWNSKNPMAFSTLNGNVDITLPAKSKFNVRLDTDRGQIYSDFNIETVKLPVSAGKRSESGVYKVSLSDEVTGKVNGGGPEIMMKNMNGNIYLRGK